MGKRITVLFSATVVIVKLASVPESTLKRLVILFCGFAIYSGKTEIVFYVNCF